MQSRRVLFHIKDRAKPGWTSTLQGCFPFQAHDTIAVLKQDGTGAPRAWESTASLTRVSACPQLSQRLCGFCRPLTQGMGETTLQWLRAVSGWHQGSGCFLSHGWGEQQGLTSASCDAAKSRPEVGRSPRLPGAGQSGGLGCRQGRENTGSWGSHL